MPCLLDLLNDVLTCHWMIAFKLVYYDDTIWFSLIVFLLDFRHVLK